ncbi:MAG: 16S rRNA (uracil(1498)-N(3))-methyltransferase [Bacteroidaceae bacterium]
MHLFYTPEIETKQELPPVEAAHCSRVLRLQVGDEIALTDGKGAFYDATITASSAKCVLFQIIATHKQAPLWSGHIHLAMAPTKNMDRNEWLAEKATEVGFDRLTFLKCRFSERKVIKNERISKILVSAMKQSQKARLPQLDELTEFKEFVQQDFSGQKFIAHCYKGQERSEFKNLIDPKQDCLLLVGPEGDFSEEEVALALECGFQPVVLGPSRLRTETAALVGVVLMNTSHY